MRVTIVQTDGGNGYTKQEVVTNAQVSTVVAFTDDRVAYLVPGGYHVARIGGVRVDIGDGDWYSASKMGLGLDTFQDVVDSQYDNVCIYVNTVAFLTEPQFVHWCHSQAKVSLDGMV